MTLFPAFSHSALVPRTRRFFGDNVRVCQRSLHLGCSSRTARIFRTSGVPKRLNVRMLGPFFPNLGDSKLLKSEIVRREKETLERDYFELAKLGQRYEVSLLLQLSSTLRTGYMGACLNPRSSYMLTRSVHNTLV